VGRVAEQVTPGAQRRAGHRAGSRGPWRPPRRAWSCHERVGRRGNPADTGPWPASSRWLQARRAVTRFRPAAADAPQCR